MRRVLGVILAGGLARRMGGGDKGLKLLGGRPLLEIIIERLRPQVQGIVLNANGDPARFASYGLPMAADAVPDFAGPLAGVLAGMHWARQHQPDITHIVTVPSDGPFLPRDLVAQLEQVCDAMETELACVASNGQPNPVVGLWPLALYDDLHAAVTREGIRKVDVWTGRHRLGVTDFVTDPVDPFFNANTPEELAEAEALWARYGAAL
ncbi:molybdenum cofactor guanylyltransferase MobA [Ferrovibrio sp.]|uniref:molybdenum cofactor guanylyltransferase MobA n=1 Tax=Ferrovibrio sp. TaxID=1917215 RepID=UPI003D13D698